MPRISLVIAALLALVLPAAAQAGTVSRDANAVTFTADPATGAGESIDIGNDPGTSRVRSDKAISAGDGCVVSGDDLNRVDCAFSPLFIINLGGFNDTLSSDNVTGAVVVEAHGGAGGDYLNGGPNGDRLYGDAGDDNLAGFAGSDRLEGGPGENSYADGPGNDTIVGGPNNDNLVDDVGSDVFTGGDGNDNVDYRSRTGAVTVTLDGQPDDGEAGEGDNVGADVENVQTGSGNDRIVAGPSGAYISGGAGNDNIKGSPQEDRIEGNEGDDTIDSRDGHFDSIDCGPGNDTVLGDLDDATTNCEQAPDSDGDRDPNETDCQPQNPAVSHNAAEIPGNDVDENCDGKKQFFRVAGGTTYSALPKLNPTRARFLAIAATDLKAGDTISIRCKGKGCAFKSKTITVTKDTTKRSLLKLFKKRYLRKGASVTVTISHATMESVISVLKIAKGGKIARTKLCQAPGESAPNSCLD